MNLRKILVIIIIFSSIQHLGSSICYGETYLGYKLTFYNLFSPEMNAFRRTHQFSLGYQYEILGTGTVLNLEGQYNWIDEVEWKRASHNLTAWVFNLTGTFNKNDTVKLQYRYFINLVDTKLDRNCFAIEYSRLFDVCPNSFFARARLGAGFAGKFLPIYGLNLQYLPCNNSAVNLDVNWLEDGEDNPEFAFKLPVSLGVEGRFSSQGSYNGYQEPGDGIGVNYTWDPLKTTMMTSAEGKKSHHWLKGYLGDKFLF